MRFRLTKCKKQDNGVLFGVAQEPSRAEVGINRMSLLGFSPVIPVRVAARHELCLFREMFFCERGLLRIYGYGIWDSPATLPSGRPLVFSSA